MSVRQSVTEWAIATAIAAPLLVLYIAGHQFEGWVRYVCWSVFVLSIVGIFVYVIYLYSILWDDGDSDFAQKSKPIAKRNATVVFDDIKVTCTKYDGEQTTLHWSDLVEVSIFTTDGGPFVDDLFWVLSGETSTCLVPSEADGTKELLAHLQKLPGFDNEAVIRAMGSAENAMFVCWSKSSGR